MNIKTVKRNGALLQGSFGGLFSVQCTVLLFSLFFLSRQVHCYREDSILFLSCVLCMLCTGCEVVKQLWAYIKSNELQNPAKKSEILPDGKMKKVFGKEPFTVYVSIYLHIYFFLSAHMYFYSSPYT